MAVQLYVIVNVSIYLCVFYRIMLFLFNIFIKFLILVCCCVKFLFCLTGELVIHTIYICKFFFFLRLNTCCFNVSVKSGFLALHQHVHLWWEKFLLHFPYVYLLYLNFQHSWKSIIAMALNVCLSSSFTHEVKLNRVTK